MIGMFERLEETVAFVRQRTDLQPAVGVILGSGLGQLVDRMAGQVAIDYRDLPHFPAPTVAGHAGRMVIGRIGGVVVVAMQGRFHYYEGYDMKAVTFPVRVMKALGIENLLVSNASGGVHPDFEIGDLMIITDHLNLFPEHPLRGKNFSELGPRFPDMSNAYSKELIAKAKKIAAENNIKVVEGVYVGTTGPTFETPAEYKYFRTIGGDAVGMSTVPEVIVANHAGMKVFGMSIITDLGVPGKIVEVTHEEVQEIGNKVQPLMTLIMKELVKEL